MVRRRRGRLGDTWHLDEALVTIGGYRHYPWNAVDRDGDVHTWMNCFILGKRSSEVKRSRRSDSPEFKAKGAFQAIRGDETLAELAQQHKIHPDQITAWKQQLL